MQTPSFSISGEARDVAPRLAAHFGRLSEWQFRTLLLAIGALSAAMVAEGVQTFAEIARRNAALSARWAAISPVAYGTALPALHALAPVRDGNARVLLRAEGDEADREARCALTPPSSNTPAITWIALSGDGDPCVAQAAGAAVRPGDARATEEFGTARWIILDAQGAARYSSRDVPSPERLRAITALLARAESHP